MTQNDTRNDKVRAAHDKLQNAVAEMVSGDDWKRMLQVVSRFQRYSFNNHLMIFLQRPDATVVARLQPMEVALLRQEGREGHRDLRPLQVQDEDRNRQRRREKRAADTWLPRRPRLRHLAD